MLRRTCLLSVDIGTESARAALLTPDGQVVASSSQEYALNCPHPGWAEQDPESWWEATIYNIRTILERAPDVDVVAVGIGGQMHAPVPIDLEGRLVFRAVPLWCDKRSEPQCQAARGILDEEESLRITGNPIVASWTGFKFKWIKENHPEVYVRTVKFLSCKDYLNLRLTGQCFTDYSEASGTYLFDARCGAWSAELCSALGIDPAKLPDIVNASDVIGTVTKEAAELTGLKAGIPVVAGGGDMMCILLGAGIVSDGMACDITGTAADISVFTPEPLYDMRLMHLHHVTPKGGWISFGILDAGGGSYKWFKDNFCLAQVEEARERGISPYQVLSEGAATIPAGSEGLLFFPYLLGERTLGSSAGRGVFFGFTPRHTINHCSRAIMEGVSFDLRQSLEIIEAKGVPINEVRAIGGGAKSPVWCEIKSNVYGKPVKTLANFEGGIVGASMLAGLGVGLYSTVEDAVNSLVRLEKVFPPDAELAQRYDRFYELYKSLHHSFQPYYRKLSALVS